MTQERIGLVHGEHEPGEKRDWLPSLAKGLTDQGWQVYANCDLGVGLELNPKNYEKAGAQIADKKTISKLPVQLLLRYPGDEYINNLTTETLVIAMLHWETRPDRVDNFLKRKINGIALDMIKDDSGKRLVENLQLVAENGLNSALEAIRKYYPEKLSNGEPIRTTIIGSGNIGTHTTRVVTHWENPALATIIGRNVTSNSQVLEGVLEQTDILVDATDRKGLTSSIISNHQLGLTPNHCVVVDLCDDPHPKAIAGIPQGNLDNFIIGIDDPLWEEVPPEHSHDIRRVVISCYSWPGVTPEKSMEIYGTQLLPLLGLLREKGYDRLSLESENPNERALFRGTLKYFKHFVEANQK